MHITNTHRRNKHTPKELTHTESNENTEENEYTKRNEHRRQRNAPATMAPNVIIKMTKSK
ncbi:7833_t:CDS:2 [Gigaspora rosea]|nr:7833_t:CDS:2 [Gigaspora rosea]